MVTSGVNLFSLCEYTSKQSTSPYIITIYGHQVINIKTTIKLNPGDSVVSAYCTKYSKYSK